MLLRPLGPLASCLLLAASAGAASLEFEHAAELRDRLRELRKRVVVT